MLLQQESNLDDHMDIAEKVRMALPEAAICLFKKTGRQK